MLHYGSPLLQVALAQSGRSSPKCFSSNAGGMVATWKCDSETAQTLCDRGAEIVLGHIKYLALSQQNPFGR